MSDPESISNIKNAIRALIEKVNQIPKIQTEEFDSEAVKGQLIKMLEDALVRTSDVSAVYERLDAVRREIVDPVNKAIRKAGWPATLLATLGFLVGAVGVYLTWTPTARVERASKPTQNSATPVPSSKAQGLLTQETGVPPVGQAAYGKVLSTTLELETLLTAATSDKGQVAQHRDTLIGLLKGMDQITANDPSLAVTVYGFVLCERFSGNWDKVRSNSDWAEKNLPQTEYRFAIRVYGAEALAEGGSLDGAVNKYQQLLDEASTADTRGFLSPVDFIPITNGRAFVQHRLDDLKLQRTLVSAQFWIYDTDDAAGVSLEKILKGQGLVRTVVKGRWQGHKTFFQPIVFCKGTPSDQIRGKMQALVSTLIKGKDSAVVMHYENLKNPDVNNEFRSPDLDYLIILPSIKRSDGSHQQTVKKRKRS